LLEALDEPSPELRYEATRAIGELEMRQAVPKLAALLDDPDREVREMAVWALGQIGGRRAQALLQRCIEENDEELNQVASEALGDMMLLRGVDLPLFVFDPNSDDEDEWEWGTKIQDWPLDNDDSD
jgi:hypothetical protein